MPIFDQKSRSIFG